MKNFFTKRYVDFSIFVMITFLFSVAKGFADIEIDFNHKSLLGIWSIQSEDGNSAELIFKENFTYEFDFDKDSIADIKGTYVVDGNQITFQEQGEGMLCQEEGAYSYSISGSEIIFTVIQDECESRKEMFILPWVKEETYGETIARK